MSCRRGLNTGVLALYFFLFRFRRERHTADVEKGDGKDGKEGKEGESSHSRKVSIADDNTVVKGGRAGKWGRLLGNKIKISSLLYFYPNRSMNKTSLNHPFCRKLQLGLWERDSNWRGYVQTFFKRERRPSQLKCR